ncbi:hypothetical protein [Streptomyces sp900105755]|uniref:Uncharacterized protein n=1 Tax=Streptomyces sp. 900105755 TaxID=3154389 RepID=A0ABV1TY19_9ACTN
MYGHDPLAVIAVLIIVGVGISIVQYRWPTVGASIDLATKVLIALIGMLLFASGTAHQSATSVPEKKEKATSSVWAPPSVDDGAFHHRL